MDQEKFLPEVIYKPTLPKEWDPMASVAKIKKLTAVVKPKVIDIIGEFWIAHELIVTKKRPGWTWGRFCEEAGYSDKTPIRWFERYGLPWTKISGPSREPTNVGSRKPPDSENAESPKPLEEENETSPEEKDEVISRVLKRPPGLYDRGEGNEERQKEFKEAMEKALGGPKTRARNAVRPDDGDKRRVHDPVGG
jgi:hypothetical protein